MTLEKDGKADFIKDNCDRYREPLQWDVTVGERGWTQLQIQHGQVVFIAKKQMGVSG